MIFAFKGAATPVLGDFARNGFIGRKIGGAEVFVMPGPYEERRSARCTLATLAARVSQIRSEKPGSLTTLSD